MGVFDKNQAILNIYHLSIANLIPAMVFLLLMQFDLKKIFSSFTPLKKLNGSQEVAITMLYMVVALIGSQQI